MLHHFHRKHSGGSPIDSDHTDGTNLGSFQFLNISYNDPENGAREVQLRSPGNTGLFPLSVLHLNLHPAPKKFTNINTFWWRTSILSSSIPPFITGHLRDQHGGHRQQHDLHASLVSTKRRPGIPLVSNSFLEVTLISSRYL